VICEDENVAKYFCRKYQRWFSRREILQDLGGKCFKMRKGRRKGRTCSNLVIID
jgi:hypothetical protein